MTVEVGTQTTAVVGMAVQTTAARGQKSRLMRSWVLLSSSVYCLMTLRPEKKETEAQLGVKVHRIYKCIIGN